MKRLVAFLVMVVLALQGVAFAGERAARNAVTRGRGSTASAAIQTTLPFTWFFTHYVLLGTDPNNPTGVKYESTGMPFADAIRGDRITMSGSGAWDPAAEEATGGGNYVITDRNGSVKAEGTWTVTKFISFLQLRGWWGIDGWVEEGWQGPPGSPSFSGYLKLKVALDDGRTGLLASWCIMPTVPHYRGHVSDGISLRGKKLNFMDSTENEMGLEGVMFYGP